MLIIKYFKNLVFLFKLTNLTDFSFVTPTVRDICYSIVTKINENTSIDDIKEYVNNIRLNIIEVVKEKNVCVDYCFLKLNDSNLYFNIYKHKYIHGIDFINTCEKACIFVNNKELNKDLLIDMSIEIIGFDYNNILIENNFVSRQSSFLPNSKGKNYAVSAESYFEILKLVNGVCDVKMMYSF